jgi:curved DNA-binding protein
MQPAMTLADARARLGLETSDVAEIGLAFRRAAREAVAAGDDAALRSVIAARDLLRDALRPAALPAPARTSSTPVGSLVPLGPLEALRGGVVEVSIARRRLRVMVPPGMRTGEHLRLRNAGAAGEDVYLPVVIRSGDGLSVVGDDLYMTAPASPRVLEDGGRVEVLTHAGPRDLWVTPGLEAPIRLCLRGLGLPARGHRTAGRLYVRLEPSADAPSAAEDLLARFHRVWTPGRLAA